MIHAPQRKTLLYGGCQLLSPNGLHLANVSEAKARWYIAQGLGEEMENHSPDYPLVVRLTFEPKGVGHAGDDYYLQKMENICVGCKNEKDLVRFSIVPHVFRSQLPNRFKEHSSHDIVLVCHACFMAASAASQEHRRHLFGQFGLVEVGCQGENGPWRVDMHKVRVRGAAAALRQPLLPPRVRAIKEGIVRQFLGREEGSLLSEEDIDTVSSMITRHPVEGYVPPEVQCANFLGVTGCPDSGHDASGLEQRCFDFVVGWRQSFLRSVNPQFLPAGWDVSRSIRKHDDLFGPGPPKPSSFAAEGGA